LRSVEGEIVTGVFNIRTAFFCGIYECKENRVLERYGFIAVNIDDIEMGGACSMFGRRERCVQVSDGET
jgi:hypothetical protein